MARTGTADLPLHGGRVPMWLATRMARLGRTIVEALVIHYGRREVLARLAHPFWFQSLGCVMGMDWHSSGITTSVIGALKRGLGPVAGELGLHVCGGRGKHSRQTPAELRAVAERTGLDGAALERASRLTAKVDSAAVQDGFALYLHGFFVSDDGDWTVVQQGMNPARRQARRYHWLSWRAGGFVDAPHAAIEGRPEGEIVNLTDEGAAAARDAQVALAAGQGGGGGAGADVVTRELERLAADEAPPKPQPVQAELFAPPPPRAPPHLDMPAHHDVRAEDFDLRRLRATLARAAAHGPRDFADLLLAPGVGARTVLALALVAEVLHGAPSRFRDPARFSFAHGGKDGHPFPVPLDVYDQTIAVMKDAVARAKLGNDERLSAIRRLDQQARTLEPWTS